MYSKSTVFSQVISQIPKKNFDRLVKKYDGNFRIRNFSCWDHFLCMSFAQLSYRSSLRDIESCLKAQPSKLYHMGIRGNPSRTNIANANHNRDWLIYAELAQILISQARQLYKDDNPLSIDFENTIYALDSSTIDLCLSLFPWAKFRQTKGAVKLHTLLDINGSIPSYIEITDGSVHDVNILDRLPLEPGSYYVMDRAYIDFKRLYRIHQNRSYYVTRAKKNFNFKRLYSNPVDRTTGLLCDQIIKLAGQGKSKDYPDKLRRVKFYDRKKDKILVFITNDLGLPAGVVAEIYKNRWKVELFFKWIKQHLRIKSFFGTSFNSVKTQLWIGICVYVAITIIKKRYNLSLSLYSILQILSVTLFEKTDLLDLLTDANVLCERDNNLAHQLSIFDFMGHQ